MERYDYVIVGAGSAGAVLAARLSENPACAVLLLEAGLDYRSAERPQAIAVANPQAVLYDEQGVATYLWPNLQARRTEVQLPRLFWRGRGVGGSSSINGQIAIRAMLEDHDGWAALGCAGWSGAEVLPDYIRLEDDLDFGEHEYHGRGGPIPVYRAPRERWGGVDRATCEAALGLGYGWAEDHNAPGSSGVSPYAINSRDGLRVSTNDAYLEPARGRANLTIRGGALVNHIVWQGSRAIGVRVLLDGDWQSIGAGEVLLCAGAIHSPAILQRSGVGDPQHLRTLGIEPRLSLPVGENLLDHPAVALQLHLRPAAQVPTRDFRHTNVCVRYSSGLAGAGENDMMVIAFNLRGYHDLGRSVGGLIVSVYQAWSAGRVTITSADPEQDPRVDERMLTDERDLVRLRDGARRLFDLVRQPALRENCEGVLVGLTNRTVEEFAVAGNAELDAWLFAEAADAQHACGTCRMGRATDPRSVVDPDCRVLGSEGLRVIDASIMPAVPRANTHLATVMIGEHLARRLRA